MAIQDEIDAEVADRYEEFVDEFTGRTPPTATRPCTSGPCWCTSGAAYPSSTPSPGRAAAPDWSGAEAAALFRSRHTEWGPAGSRQEELADA